jgi:hypothetical protein
MEMEMDEQTAREYAAELNALRFISEILLAHLLAHTPADSRKEFIAQVLLVGRRTDHLRARSEHEAEEIADVAVLTQQRIERLVERALERAGES